MTYLERAIRKAVRYFSARMYLHQRSQRQKQLARAMPTIAMRGKQIALARKSHKPCKRMIEANRAEMTAALRRELGQDVRGA